MLYEISHLQQTNRSLIKRWFTGRDMDLFVCCHRSMPVSFQLNFNTHGGKQAISWDRQQGFHLYLLDSNAPYPNRHRKTPLLINRCDQDNLAIIKRNFLVACENIDVGLTDFIYARLMEYPSSHTQPHASHTDHPVVK